MTNSNVIFITRLTPPTHLGCAGIIMQDRQHEKESGFAHSTELNKILLEEQVRVGIKS